MSKKFLIPSRTLYKLRVIDTRYNILPKKYSSLSKKMYRYYVLLVKYYKLLGLLAPKKIKLRILNRKNGQLA